MIEFKNVSKAYNGKSAVQDLSFSIPNGRLCVFIGPSGCGKTTSLKMINRLVEPDSGEIIIDGKNIMEMDAVALRRRIGYVIQSIGLFPHLTVSQNIATVPNLLGWDKAKTAERVAELLELVELAPSDYASKYPSQLSGGEAQRIGVARALAAEPDILLMDEPFGAVDPLTREVLQEEFLNIQKRLKKTVIFVTHDLDEAVRLGDLIALLRDGRLIQMASPEDLLSKPSNQFVHDFVGTDRGLKRLSRVPVSRYMSKAVHVHEAEIVTDMSRAIGYAWVLDETEAFTGWIDLTNALPGGTVSDSMTRIKRDDIAVHHDSSLKDALSRMMNQSLLSLPVLDDEHKLTGTISLDDIQKSFKDNLDA